MTIFANGQFNMIMYAKTYKKFLVSALLIAGLNDIGLSQSQVTFFKGSFQDEFKNPIAYVTIKLIGQNKLYSSGVTGEFGIASARKTDSAWCYAEGFDTLKTVLNGDHFQNYTLYISGAMRENLIRAASLSHESFEEIKTEGFKFQHENSETYLQLAENQRLSAALHSSFRYVPNNNTASLSNIRRMARQAIHVPPDAVRIDEMWNYYQLRLNHTPAKENAFNMNAQLTTCPWDSTRYLLMLNAISPMVDFSEMPPANMVFLIDNSGSMAEKNRLDILKTGFRAMALNLRDQDRVAIVTYGGSPGIFLPPTFGTNKSKIIRAIDSLYAGGSTQGSNGIHLAYLLATSNPFAEGTNSIILATDGDFNVGAISEAELEEMISRYRSTGVPLSCIGVGMGNYKDSKVELLAKLGRGNFGYVENDEEASRTLMNWYTRNLYTTASDVTFSVNFDSSLIADYKIVGYNNKVRSLQSPVRNILGSDMGAGQSSVALFELSLKKPLQQNEFLAAGNWSVQYRNDAAATELTTQAHPIMLPLQAWSDTDSSFKAATLLSQLGFMLREVPGQPETAFTELETNITSWFHLDDPFRADAEALVANLKNVYCPPEKNVPPQKKAARKTGSRNKKDRNN